MFVLQPGQGLGHVHQELGLGLPGQGIQVILPPSPKPGEGTGGGRGSGPTSGIRPEGYNRQHEDALRETRRKRILQEDNDIVALIVTMLTKDLM